MSSNAPFSLAARRQPPPADRAASARWFDGWQPEPADPTMDAVDRVLGRAAFDAAFRAELLANPAAALAAEPMLLALKRALVAIRASTLAEFARRALEARALHGADPDPSPEPEPPLDSAMLASASF